MDSVYWGRAGGRRDEWWGQVGRQMQIIPYIGTHKEAEKVFVSLFLSSHSLYIGCWQQFDTTSNSVPL